MTLKELRKERRMTQSEVGEVIGTDDRTYRKYENGEVKLSGIRLQILADFFGVPANEIDLKVRKEWCPTWSKLSCSPTRGPFPRLS